jgi:hypothetical protein
MSKSSTENTFFTIIRPDGSKLFINTNQIVYVTKDVLDEQGKKTEVMTTQGSFIVNKPVDEILKLMNIKEIL